MKSQDAASVLQNVTKCYKMLQNVTKCYKMLQNVTKQSKSHNAVSVLNNHEEVECDEKVTTLRVKG